MTVARNSRILFHLTHLKGALIQLPVIACNPISLHFFRLTHPHHHNRYRNFKRPFRLLNHLYNGNPIPIVLTISHSTSSFSTVFLLCNLTTNMADDSSDPGQILVINGQPCDNCASELTQSLSPRILIDTINTPSDVKFQASQITTTDPLPPGSVTTNHETTTSASEGSVSQSSASSTSSGESKSSHSITSLSYGPTSPLPTTSTSSTTSKSSADTVKVHHILRSALAIYTVTFTLFLLPIPKMNPFEFILISTTCITGWMLLYLDSLLIFLRNPHQQITSLTKSFKIGLLNYIVERWYTFQLIRRRNQPHTTLHFPPVNISRGPSSRLRLGAWWKSDILSNLKKHNLRDYFNNPTPADFSRKILSPQNSRPPRSR